MKKNILLMAFLGLSVSAIAQTTPYNLNNPNIRQVPTQNNNNNSQEQKQPANSNNGNYPSHQEIMNSKANCSLLRMDWGPEETRICPFKPTHQKIQDKIDALKASLKSTTGSGQQGAYGLVGRQNDIYVFCKYGMNDLPEIHYWKSVDPSTGNFVITNYYHVNYRYIPEFVVFCPMAGQQPGNWKGAGTGAEVKANSQTGKPVVPFIH